MIKEYPEFHQKGTISVENKDMILKNENSLDEAIHGDLGIQIARDGRIWVCINGISFIRFKPEVIDVKDRWAIALRRTWDYIGGDILRANNNKDMPRSHVFEVCVDYIDVHGKLSKEDLEAFRKRDIKKDRTLTKLAFPAAKYGI